MSTIWTVSVDAMAGSGDREVVGDKVALLVFAALLAISVDIVPHLDVRADAVVAAHLDDQRLAAPERDGDQESLPIG
jgi:hypothetical protein